MSEHRKNGKGFPVLAARHQRFVCEGVAMAAGGSVVANKATPHDKKAGEAGLSFFRWRRSSVFRDNRATPTIVDADRDKIDVLADAIIAERRGGNTDHAVVEEVDGAILQEQMIVFDRGRPVRGEAIFEADTDRDAPAGVITGIGDFHLGSGEADAEVIRHHSRAALEVEQRVVGGVTNLTGEQAERIDARLVLECREGEADIAALEVRPVALCFQTEHPGAGLPADTELTARRAAGRVMATFGG